MKVAFVDTVHEVLHQGLTKLGYECVDLTSVEVAQIHESIHEYQGLVVRSRFPVDSSFLTKATSLRFIARSGAGMENIDLDFCASNGIEVFSAPEGNRNAVAEHALGMLLSLFNKLHTADREVRDGKWDREGNRGIELDGKTVGIIGFGNNGSAFARKLQGFDVEVLAYDKYRTGFETSEVKEVELEELMVEADIISLHIPQNEESKWMIDADFINKVSKPFFLINLSRGKLVRTKDLLTALDSGKIKGACLDVLEFEKSSFEDMFANGIDPEFERLLQHKKVILSPHVGGWTHESYFKLSQVLLEKIAAKFHS